jgi:DnaJ-class molecular chaperone
MLHVTIINASLAYTINQFKNINGKILKRKANIFFNKQCNLKGLTPTYAKINVPNTSPASLQKIIVETDTDINSFISLTHNGMSNVKMTHNGHLVCRMNMTVTNSVSKRPVYSPIQKLY